MRRAIVTTIITLALALMFGVLNPGYLSKGSLLVILRTIAYPGIIAIGVALCLMGGTIDLSVGSVAGLAAVLAARLMTMDWPVWAAMAAALVMGAVVGSANAFMVLKLKLSTFMATLGMMFALRGVVYAISRGWYIYPLPNVVKEIGQAKPLGISWAFIIFIVLLVIVQWLLSRTVWGLSVKATGSDREVAFCNEVDVDKIQTHLHIIVSILAALAGLLVLCKMGGGDSSIGDGMQLVVIAGCVIGGVSLFGYEGSMPAVFIGLLFLKVVTMGVITSGVGVYLQATVQGIIMVAAMVVDARRKETTFFRRTV